jgi:hypothetical protein
MTKEALIKRLSNHRNKAARFYDYGDTSFDRYTAVYLKPEGEHPRRWFGYRGMSNYPYHPMGYGIYSDSNDWPVDRSESGYVVSLGRKNHLGKRIRFQDLPPDCQRCVLHDILDT